MGQYTTLSVNTHIKKDKLEELGYLITGFTGAIAMPYMYNEKRGEFQCFPGYNISFSINEEDEIILKSSAKWLSYYEASSYKFGTFKTIERLANYIGNCDVKIHSEEGITPHSLAVNGTYKYTTMEKNHPDTFLYKNLLKDKVMGFEPYLINVDLYYKMKDDKNSFLSIDKVNRIIQRDFKDIITTPIQLANISAFLSYTNKEDMDFTVKDVEDYLKKDNRNYFYLNRGLFELFHTSDVLHKPLNLRISSEMRCKGLQEFFISIQREDLAAIVKEKEQFLEKKQAIIKRQEDYNLLLTSENNYPDVRYWTLDDDKVHHNYFTGDNAVTITKYDDSDFYHMNYENELYQFPFGVESISVTLLPNGKVSFSYKNDENFDYTGKKERTNGFVGLLYKIKHPLFLKSVLDRITECKNQLNYPLSHYITDSEIRDLQEKIPFMEERLQEKKNEVIQSFEDTFLFLNVPYSEKDEVRDLGAKWNVAKKSWYISKDMDLHKFEKWIPKEIKEQINQQEGEIEYE